jgi:hypothetical protein
MLMPVQQIVTLNCTRTVTHSHTHLPIRPSAYVKIAANLFNRGCLDTQHLSGLLTNLTTSKNEHTRRLHDSFESVENF